MGRIAFVFSGQGDQYPGMGKDLYEKYEVAKRVFDECEAVRPGTIAQCFYGTEEELRLTINTQPCMFAMELAAAKVIEEMGIKPAALAGFSLGEVAALTVSGAVDLKTGFELVCKRAEFMQKASEEHEMTMAAVIKLSTEQIESLCNEFSNVYPVNFNCPGQITVSGVAEQMPKFYVRVKESGGRAIPLKVKCGFHSPFMKEAAEKFSMVLENSKIDPCKIPVYANLTANMYEYNAVELLSRQICSPVKWEQSIRNMIDNGVDTFVEIGPGKTLCNMIKKIDSSVKFYSVAELVDSLTEVEVC